MKKNKALRADVEKSVVEYCFDEECSINTIQALRGTETSTPTNSIYESLLLHKENPKQKAKWERFLAKSAQNGTTLDKKKITTKILKLLTSKLSEESSATYNLKNFLKRKPIKAVGSYLLVAIESTWADADRCDRYNI